MPDEIHNLMYRIKVLQTEIQGLHEKVRKQLNQRDLDTIKEFYNAAVMLLLEETCAMIRDLMEKGTMKPIDINIDLLNMVSKHLRKVIR